MWEMGEKGWEMEEEGRKKGWEIGEKGVGDGRKVLEDRIKGSEKRGG